jgi:hypothetical protein
MLKALMRIRSRQFIFFTLCPPLKLPAPSEFSSPFFSKPPNLLADFFLPFEFFCRTRKSALAVAALASRQNASQKPC